jgi:type II secretory ATPase GspE/PulE/Tfp pilus assembly ATPase PilB-like protein
MKLQAKTIGGQPVAIESDNRELAHVAKAIAYSFAHEKRIVPLALSKDGLVLALVDGDFYRDEDIALVQSLASRHLETAIDATTSIVLSDPDFAHLLEDLFAVHAQLPDRSLLPIRRGSRTFISAAHQTDRDTAFLHMILPVQIDGDNAMIVAVPDDGIDRSVPAMEALGTTDLTFATISKALLTELINAAFVAPIESAEESLVLRDFDAIMTAAVRQRAKSVFFDTMGGRTVITVRVGRQRVPLQSPLARSLPRAMVRQLTNALMSAANSQTDDDQAFDYDFNVERIIAGKPMSFRGASLPASGETLVLRITGEGTQFDLDRIGFLDEQLPRVPYIVERPGGAVIASAPPGHGKSTLIRMLLSLYYEADHSRRLYAAENPVEHYLWYVRHVNLERAQRLTFERLREQFVRMEADGVFLGEMRSDITYKIAFELAEATDKFFGTTHAFNVPLTFHELFERTSRLNVAMHIDTIFGQRLIATLCHACSERVAVDPEGPHARYHRPFMQLLEQHHPDRAGTIYVRRPRANAGCDACTLGYRDFDRPVFEIFEMNEPARAAILRGEDPYTIVGYDPLYKPMVYHALLLALDGTISVESLFRSVRTDAFSYRPEKETADRARSSVA